MDKKKYEHVIALLTKAKLGNSLRGILGEAEDAWKAQRQAISLIDLKNDAVKGEKRLKELQIALNAWIIKLEIFAHGSQKIAKGAHKALHTSGYYFKPETDSQGHGTDEVGGKDAEPGDKGQANNRTGSGRRPRRHRASGHADKSGSKVINKGTGESTSHSRKVSSGGI